jgi:large subunit ribosomal protein L4
MEETLYNQKGESMGKINLPSMIFSLPWNSDLVHQVVTSMQSSSRHSIAHTKNRGEVRGGGKKPWQQKGTGQARHGSTRSPIWVGGGVTHGPRNEKNYDRKVNKKMKTKALFTILSRKYKDGEITFIDNLTLKTPKTKEALATIASLAKIPAIKNVVSKKSNALYIAMPTKSSDISRGFSNIANVTVEETRNINPVSLLTYKHILFVYPEETLRVLESKASSKNEEGVATASVKTPRASKKTAVKKVVKKPKATAKK